MRSLNAAYRNRAADRSGLRSTAVLKASSAVLTSLRLQARGRQRDVDQRQIRLEPGGGFEFGLGAHIVLLPQRKRA